MVRVLRWLLLEERRASARCSENAWSVHEPESGRSGPRACSAIVLVSVIGDVLADPLLVRTVEMDDRRLAQEVVARLELEPFELVVLDLERQDA